MLGRATYYPWLFWLLMLIGSGVTAHAQSFQLKGNRKQVNFPFRLIRNMVVIKVSINNNGPYNFILDTGVGMMIITDPSLIDSLNITSKRTLKLAGLGVGEDYEAYMTGPLDVEIHGIKSDHVGAAIFKKDHFGLSNYAGIPIHGLLGFEFFNKLAVKLDFADSTLTAYSPGRMKIPKKYEQVPISIENNKPYVNTNVRFCDNSTRSCKLIVDIGAGHPLSLDNKSDNPWPTDKAIAANLGMGLTGPINGELSRVTQLSLGKYDLTNVLSSFPEVCTKMGPVTARDGNIGMEVLKRFTVIFDYASNLMYLRPRGNLKEPFEHDMSGMEYYAGGEDLKHIIISRVEPGSASDQIGLEKDDEILSINFKGVEHLGLEDLDRMFRSGNGRGLLLEIYRDKQYSRVVLVLKRRI